MIECPYCRALMPEPEFDGTAAWPEECGLCGKTVWIEAEMVVAYSARKPPCLNGGRHTWLRVYKADGRRHWACAYCGARKTGLGDKQKGGGHGQD